MTDEDATVATLTATEINGTGYTAEIATWPETRVYSVAFSWLVLGSVTSGIYSLLWTLASQVAIFVPMRILLIIALCLTGYAAEFDWDLVSRADFSSPDNQRVATVFRMTCNCTTGYFPQLTVRRTDEKISAYGNVISGGPDESIKVKWTSPTNLLVEHFQARQKIDSPSVTNFAGVRIEILPRKR